MSDLINDTEKHTNELKQDDKYFCARVISSLIHKLF